VREPRATIDFETRSSAGIYWDAILGKLVGPPGSGQGKKGLSVVNAYAYAEHPTTDILTLSWKIPAWQMRGRWRPGQPLHLLQPLFQWIEANGLVEAHNVMFERLIWWFVGGPRYGFPPLRVDRLACSMATARVNQFPGGLGALGDVLELPLRKDKDGTRLLNKFSVPNKPTKKRPSLWITPEEDPEDAERLYAYCDRDTDTEELASETMPPMTPTEREFWLVDQEINWRGMAVDRAGVRACITILQAALERYGEEFTAITGGITPTQLQQFQGWLRARGVYTDSLDAEHLEALLARKGLPADARRCLEIRDLIGSASVKKIFAMENQAGTDDRLHNLIIHHGTRTGRPTGEGPQPLNLPKAGPKLATCATCQGPFHPKHVVCPWCGQVRPPKVKLAWKPEMVSPLLDVMATGSLDAVEYFFGDAVLCIMGCVRGLFQAGPGMDLIASDYSAIEAVVTAMLAGEDWRIETFRRKEDIYLMSAAKITGRTAEFYKQYHEETGDKHPDRQDYGKVAELALGFGGWIGAWRNFDDSDTFTDQEVKNNILAWRDASPMVIELWGGQSRGSWQDRYPCLYGFEGAAVAALQNPGWCYTVSGIQFFVRPRGAPFRDEDGTAGVMPRDALIIRLLSGRELTYWDPELTPSTRDYDPPWQVSITYSTHNTNPKYGPVGWVRMNTYGGRLTENIVQATAHCILRYAILNLRAAGYHTVLHVYDEIVVEVPQDAPEGALEEVERIMGTMPPWAADWPVRASGGWRGKRYRKD